MHANLPQPDRLIVVDVGAGKELCAVDQALRREGYSVQLRTADQVIASMPDPPAGSPSSVLVCVFGDGNESCRRLHSILDQGSAASVLVIFTAMRRDWESRVVHGCDEFTTWPCDCRELRARVDRLLRADRRTSSESSLELLKGAGILGRSPAFLSTLRNIDKFAQCDVPVLIEGETGTGKEVTARGIHYLSTRSSGPFVPVNCGALPEGLVENEFFGHRRGAYTGAEQNVSGLIAQADGGSLFLDEVDALTPRAQVTLLRFLDGKEYRPVGGGSTRTADVRVVAASNADLLTLVRKGGFRNDLFFRLNLLSLGLPPLRERTGDVLILAEHFMTKYGRQYSKSCRAIDRASTKWMVAYSWPGNVRELENVVHKAVLLSESAKLSIPKPRAGRDRPTLRKTDAKFTPLYFDIELSQAKSQVIAEFESEYLRRLLTQTQGNVTAAAEIAGKERRTFGKLLKKYRIRRSDFVGKA